MKETVTECWSVRKLERNIKSGYYKRILSTQFPDKTGQVPQFVKDPYVLEFMGIKDNDRIVEKNVENAIISQEDDNPTIGIIFCMDKDELEMEFLKNIIIYGEIRK